MNAWWSAHERWLDQQRLEREAAARLAWLSALEYAQEDDDDEG